MNGECDNKITRHYHPGLRNTHALLLEHPDDTMPTKPTKSRCALFLTQETIVLEEKTRIQDWSQSEQELSLCARQHLHLSIILSLPTHHPFDLSRLYPFAGCLYFLRRPQTLCTVVNIIVLYMMEAFRQICFLVPSVGLDTCACTQRWELFALWTMIADDTLWGNICSKVKAVQVYGFSATT